MQSYYILAFVRQPLFITFAPHYSFSLMRIIKVDAIDSSNSYARELFRSNSFPEPFCVVAQEQLKGRGQRGTSWNAKPGQNLTFSVLLPQPCVSLSHQFLLSAAVATSIIRALSILNIPKLKLKWPNDIMSANFKIGGILIENIVSEGVLAASILGIGLNVNQTEFEGLPSASSLKLVTGQHYLLEELLDKILRVIEKDLDGISDVGADAILGAYKRKLFRKGMVSTFQRKDKTFFSGIIEDVSLEGFLQVRTDRGIQEEFDLKEVRLCY